MTAAEVIDNYLAFYKERGHIQIPNASLVPENDPTTLFTSSGMQPLIPYLLGEQHPQGTRLVNSQNCFRAQDIDEVGDNRHTTFFRMLGNWSLGDYFKNEQIPWVWEFMTHVLGLPKEKLFVSVFAGGDGIEKDTEAVMLWEEIFRDEGLNAKERIFTYGVEKNWWSRSGIPANMPVGEPGGPDSEIFYDFQTPHDSAFGKECHINCDCGRYMEIGNSVFMQFKKAQNGFKELPQKNVDFGGGLERLIAATENTPDVFMTSLFRPIITSIEVTSGKDYSTYNREMRIVADHLTGATFIVADGIVPSNKEQGYIARRLIRRAIDNYYKLSGKEVEKVLRTIITQYQKTDPYLADQYEHIKGVILEEVAVYESTLRNAKTYLQKKYPLAVPAKGINVIPREHQGDDLMGVTEISGSDAFKLYTSYGLSPTQIKSMGYTFDDQNFARLMEKHQSLSRKGAEKKFKGGLADHEEKTVHGHTVTHLLHKALRDKFGEQLHQTGSNITTERVRFDFNFERKLTADEIKAIEDVVNDKIKEDMPVYFRIIPLKKARQLNAIGLFGEKYEDMVKVYFIGGNEGEIDKYLSESSPSAETKEERLKTLLRGVYSIEFCGGPHVKHTGVLKKFKVTKEEGLGKGMRRLYSVVE